MIKIQAIIFHVKYSSYKSSLIDNESFSECIIWIFPERGSIKNCIGF